MSKRFSLMMVILVMAASMLACSMPGSTNQPVAPTVGQADLNNTAVAAAAATLVSGQPTAIPATSTIAATATSTATVTATSVPPTDTQAPTEAKPTIPCNAAQFVSDVTYPDNTEVKVGASFTKTWRLKNTGSCTWTADYKIVFASGEAMNAHDSALTSGQVANGQTVDVSVALTAPSSTGTYQGAFKLRAPDGSTFGIGAGASEAFWVQIVAVKSPILIVTLKPGDPTRRPVIPTVKPVIPTLSRNLKLTDPYMKGQDVTNLQKRLLDLGYSEVESADGVFGPKTDKAVRHFQHDKGLTVDGVVGKQTWEALFK